jgi:DNA-binding MarR family transcriptional regulator
VFGILKRMREKELITKRKINPKNVQYELTKKGKKLFEEKCLERRNYLLSLLKKSPEKEEIIFQLLAEKVAQKLPKKWKKGEKFDFLKRTLKEMVKKSSILWN